MRNAGVPVARVVIHFLACRPACLQSSPPRLDLLTSEAWTTTSCRHPSCRCVGLLRPPTCRRQPAVYTPSAAQPRAQERTR
jgi:hypothetical protein